MYDVVVVGSGFGGAVTACRLAQGGMDVLVLERGRWWGTGDDAPAPRRRFPRGLPAIARAVRSVQVRRGPAPLHREVVLDRGGLYELHLFRHLDVLTASGVGGGSLIYTNAQVQPDADFFAAFPAELRGGELDTDFAAVRTMLRPEPLTLGPGGGARTPTKTATFTRAARDLGRGGDLVAPDLAVVHGDPDAPTPVVNAAGVAQSTCRWCGDCMLGCNDRAKTSLDLTYLPAAIAAGAEVRSLADVRGIGPRGDGTAGTWQVRYRDLDAGVDRVVAARRVVLAAGTLGTLRLLLRARDRHRTLPDLSPRLGAGFSGNADQATVLRNARDAFHGERGPALTAGVTRRAGDGTHRSIVAEAGIPTAGLGVPGPLRDRLAGTHVLLGMGASDSAATVVADPAGGDGLDVDQANAHDPEAFAAIDADVASLADAVGAATAVQRLRLSAGPQANFSVHPLGGCGIGTTTATGVTDHAGRVFGAEGLLVADGSLYPRSVGLPPSMTIAALAERIARLALQE